MDKFVGKGQRSGSFNGFKEFLGRSRVKIFPNKYKYGWLNLIGCSRVSDRQTDDGS